MKNIDELLNRYLDGELSGEDLTELKKILDSDTEISDKMRALKAVDLLLSDLPEERTNDKFTENVMSKINPPKTGAVVNSQTGFLSGMFLFFAFVLLSILFFIIKFNPENNNAYGDIINRFSNQLENWTAFLGNIIFNSASILYSSLLLTGALISSFIIIQTHRKFKETINSFN